MNQLISASVKRFRALLAGVSGAAQVGYQARDGAGVIADAQPATLEDVAMEVVTLTQFLTPNQRQAVRNNTVMDLTVPMQKFLDYVESGRPKVGKVRGDVRVTKVTVGRLGNRNNSLIDFYGSTLIGIGGGSSIVQLKTGFKYLFGLSVAGQQSEAYECGVHWFTNDVATYYPGFATLRDWSIAGCLIGLCIGALPSQAAIPPFDPPAVLDDGQAVNAPLSESVIDGLRVKDCIIPLYMRQPNGKITLKAPMLVAENGAWAATPATAEGNMSAFTIKQGELSIIGGSVLNILSTTGQLGAVESGTLNIVGAVMESKAPIYVGGRSTVRASHIKNWGLNNDAQVFFCVRDTADGQLLVSQSFLRRGYGTTSAQPVLRVVDGAGVTSVNSKFVAAFDHVEFGDPNITQGGVYKPLTIGCRSVFKDCWVTAHGAAEPYARSMSMRFDEGGNALVGAVDLAARTITAYGVNGSAASGGWTFQTAAATSWGRYAVGLPTIEGLAVSNCLRLTSTGAGTSLQATSALIKVRPQRAYLVKGWAKTGGTGAVMAVRMNFFDFAGAPSAVQAQVNLYSGVESAFAQGAVWAPFALWFVVPEDACQASLNIYTENGADVQVLDLGVV